MLRLILAFAATVIVLPRPAHGGPAFVPEPAQNKVEFAFPDGNEYDIASPDPLTIQVVASFSPETYAFAAASFDLTADNSGSFLNPTLLLNGLASTAGTVTDTGVVGVSENQLHAPSVGMLADTANPLAIWEVQWTTSDYSLREIDLKTDLSALFFYTDSEGRNSSFFAPGTDATGSILVVPAPPSVLLLSLCAAWRRRPANAARTQDERPRAPIGRRGTLIGAGAVILIASAAAAQVNTADSVTPARTTDHHEIDPIPGTPDRVISDTDRTATQEDLERLKKELNKQISDLKKKADEGEDGAQEALDEAIKGASLVDEVLQKLNAGTATATQLQKALIAAEDALCKVRGILDQVFALLRDLLRNIIGLFETIIDSVKKIFEGTDAEHQATGAVQIPGLTDFESTAVATHICIEPELGLHDAPIVLDLSNCSSSFTVNTQATEGSDLFSISVVLLAGFAPSFELLPGLWTGDNVQSLDDSIPSVGSYDSSTGQIELELFTKIVNDLFPPENPILVYSRINGHFDPMTGELSVRSDAFDFVNLQTVPTELVELPDDGFIEQPLQFTFDGLGTPVQSVFIGSNGFITTGEGDSDPTPTVAEFLSGPPRFAALWTDLDPSSGGEVSIVSDPDRLAVYFRDVPVKDSDSSTASFVIVLTDEGHLVVDNRGMSTTGDAICGFSRGGLPTPGDETESDLTDPFLPHGILENDTAIFEAFGAGDPLDLPVLAFGFHPGIDCNANDLDDETDIVTAVSSDCNANGVPDECDIDSGKSMDEDGNGVPDECECYADFDQSTGVSVLDAFDVLSFLNAYLNQEEQADCNDDGVVDAGDIVCYFAEFNAGCP